MSRRAQWRDPPLLEYLREYFRYEPATGEIWRLKNARHPGGKVGPTYPKSATTHIGGGYLVVTIGQEQFPASRIAWYLHTGEWPGDFDIDHRNNIPSDNRIDNLRLATRSQNSHRKRTPSALKGAFLDKRCITNPWRAQIKVEGKLHYLGMFPTAEEANCAYASAAKKFYGEFADQ